MITLRAWLAWLGLGAPLLDSGVCVCGCAEDAHQHFRPGMDCGRCGADQCPKFDPVDIEDVCRDQQVIEAVKAGDGDYARTIAPDDFVTLIELLYAAGKASR